MGIAVCDDDVSTRDDIVRMIRKQHPEAERELSVFSSGEELLESEENFAITFLDIEMGKISGMDAAKCIREKQERRGLKRSIIIFVTGYREYMEEAFDVNAYHYLLKPIDEDKFAAVFERAWREMSAAEEENRRYIMIKSLGVLQKIFLKDICYIESSNKKVIIHTKDSVIQGYGKMENYENELGENFYRCHRGYLVNMENITAYCTDTIQVLNGDRILLARKKYPDFVRKYMNYARSGGIVNV